jgi:hypothetical protein
VLGTFISLSLFFFLVVLGLELWVLTLARQVLVLGIFEVGLLELFPQAGFQLRSS